ncbi:MAG: chemotaxis protein CheA [Deltaproteobacteria bacterium]|nr:chemotaxis protein CheA [Deltaproteobacteria bacterium]
MPKKDFKQERAKEFLAEAEDILSSMGKGLVKLGRGVKAGVIDPVVLNGIFRAAHTLKGMAGIYEFKDMAELSHSLEDALDSLRLGKTTLDDGVMGALMGAYELLARIASAKGGTGFAPELASIKARLAHTPQGRANSEVGIDDELKALLTEYEEHRLRENIRDGRNIFMVNCNFPIGTFDKDYLELVDIIKTRAELIATLPSSRTNHERLYFDILLGTPDGIAAFNGLIGGRHGAAVRPAGEGRAPVPQPQPAAPMVGADAPSLRRSGNTVRVSIAKLDRIMNQIGELGVLKSNLSRLSVALKGVKEFSIYGIELSRTEAGFERKLNELRSGVLDIRMVPIGQLFSRFEPFIEKLGRETGKEVRMLANGEETELDKLVIEELADPLMHIIRNAVDHALEPASAREAAGKPAYGTITLSAWQKGNHAVVEVKDDGCGIDDGFVREKAAQKGIAPPEYLAGLSRQEAIELIFTPGFSTRDTVNETSGRGVGMDVVKENITRLSGAIDVETVKGKGTRIILTIPVTLAIIAALIVETSGARYAVPLASVVEITELRPGPSYPARRADSSGYVTALGVELPAVRLSEFFGKPAFDRDVVYGIIAGPAEHRLCVIVDRLVEELDVIIKPLPRMIRAPGVAGAADMGEKGTMLVLDVTGIFEEISGRAPQRLKA